MTEYQMSPEERIASEGLDIRGFHGKWKSAQKSVSSGNVGSHYKGLPYWEQVRLMFLELGGEFIGQKYGESQ